MKETTTSINQTPCTLRTVRYCLPIEACDRCEQPAPRYSIAHRTAIDLDLDHPVLLDVQVSVHYCLECHHYFRAQPPFLRRDGIYTEQVIHKTIDAVFKDGMAYRRVTQRMERDFWVQPCEGSIRRWCKNYGSGFHFETDYQEWVVSEFSGILCVDEVYQNELALLLAVDPAAPDGDRMIGYQLIHGSVNADDIQSFMDRLKAAGINPEQVVTDGSSLYPAVLKEVWPKAAHQLCLFHETRRITRAALKAINAVRKQIPVPLRQNSTWHGGPLTEQPPVAEAVDSATRRWYWRRLQRHHRIKKVHELAAAGLSQRAIARQTGHHRRTVRSWLQQPIPPLPTDTPAAMSLEAVILPAPEQRRLEKQQRKVQVKALADQGYNHSAIGRIIGIHRITVKKWLQQATIPAETIVTDLEDKPLPSGWNSLEEIEQTHELLRQHRFLFVRRPESLSTEESQIINTLLASPVGAQLATIRAFTTGWYRIWWRIRDERQTPTVARSNYESWCQTAEFLAVPALRRVISQVTTAKFEKMAHFLHDDHWEATNNGAERMGRAFRHSQAPHYNLRRPETLEAAITVAAFLRKEKASCLPARRFHHCQRGRRATLTT